MTVWNFSCLENASSYDLEVGPSRGLAPALRRPLAFSYMDNTAASATVMTKPAAGITATLKGTLLTQAQYNALGAWWQKGNRVRITDRLGRIFTVLITELDRQRVRSATTPWKHTWTMSVDVLQVIFPALPGGSTVTSPTAYLTWADAEGTWDGHTEIWTEATV